MNRLRHWIWAVLATTAAAVCMIQLCRWRSGALSPTDGTGDLTAALSRNSDSAPVYEFALLRDESRAFCRTNRNRIEIRDVQSGETLAALDFRGKPPIAMSTASRNVPVHSAKRPQGTMDDALLVGYGDGSLVLWSVDADGGRHRPQLLVRQPSMVCCALSRDGRIAATGHDDGTVILRDARTGARLHRLRAHSGTVSCVRFSRDGTRLLSARRTVCVWKVRSGKRLVRIPARGSVLGAVELSDDGRFVISANRNWGTVAYWNAETATEVWSTQLRQRTPSAVACSPDRRIVAVGDSVGEVRLFAAKSGRRIAMLPDTLSVVSCVRFSADGTRLFVSRQNGSIRNWDLADDLDRRKPVLRGSLSAPRIDPMSWETHMADCGFPRESP